jgi:protocatechuate 3,4-dioxygenase beta subunit
MHHRTPASTRSHALLASGAAALALCAMAQAQTCTATLAQTEGPYYRSPNPETQMMWRSADGPLFTLRGKVVDTNCNPIPWTWVAVWHADGAGNYDNTAPYDIYRATYFTDANGEFTFYTLKAGLYPGRTRHIHIKVDAANTALLTTQLYWPGEAGNASDGIYNASLLMSVTTNPDGTTTGYKEFVLPVTGGCTGATITQNPSSTSAAVGGTASFTANGAGSTPRTFRWYHNGTLVENNARISGANTGTITITGVTAADAGSWVCGSHNSCGSQLSTAATLQVTGLCPADLNGDHVVDGADLGALLAAWGTCSGCAADLNADGAVDGADLGALLAVWGACP